jgi:hypothetical protein
VHHAAAPHGLLVAALAVDDAGSCRHPVHVAGHDDLPRPEAVPVHDLAVEEVRHGREPDVRVRPDLDVLSRRDVERPHVVEEHERPHAPTLHRRE